jgi:hypothetical protein
MAAAIRSLLSRACKAKLKLDILYIKGSIQAGSLDMSIDLGVGMPIEVAPLCPGDGHGLMVPTGITFAYVRGDGVGHGAVYRRISQGVSQ